MARDNVQLTGFFEFMLEKRDFMVLTIRKLALMFRRTSRDDLFLRERVAQPVEQLTFNQ